MASTTVLVERDAGVVTVTMNRPERKNAANHEMWAALLAAFQEIRSRNDDRVVVLTGAGGDFCSGADVSGSDGGAGGGNPLGTMRLVNDTAMALSRIPQPVVAKVRGVAVGAGMNMALLCDVLVAGESARFSEIFARRGLSIDFGGSWALPRRVGLHKAKELALFADIIGADVAAELGLVNRVVPDADLDKVVGEWAARLASGPPIALAQTKRLLNEGLGSTLEEALEAEAAAQAINFGTADTSEAMRAFVEKRDPVFRGA